MKFARTNDDVNDENLKQWNKQLKQITFSHPEWMLDQIRTKKLILKIKIYFYYTWHMRRICFI